MSDVYGVGLWGEPPASSNEAELERRRFARPASGDARTRAVLGSASEWLSFNLLGEGLQAQARSTDWNDVILGLPSQQRLIEPEVLNERYGIEGVLSFDAATSESWAAHRYERAQRELFRQDVISRAESGGPVSDFVLSLVVGILDPVNVIFPFGRLNSLRAAAPGLAAMEAGEAMLPRMLARGAFGVTEGAVFSAVLEPGFYGLAAAAERDYGLADSLINVVAGAGVGGFFNAVGGAFSGPSAEAIVERRRMPEDVRAASTETRAAATMHAVQAMGEGQPVEAARIYAATNARRQAELASFTASADAIRFAPVRDTEVFTPAGGREQARYAIVEVDDIIASHTDELAVDPRYPGALQPRDRTRAASEAQLTQFGAPFEAARWGETFQGDAGAPVVGSDGAVESGNARTIWMRRAYRAGDNRAEAYRAWLKAQGYPVDDFKRPMLVRLTDAGRDPAARVRFAEELNKPASAVMSAMEIAFADARRLDAGLLDAVGEDRQAFQRQALAKLTSEAERGGLIDADGAMAQAGTRRIEAALMAKAYDDPALIETRFESADAELKTIGGALADAAPAMARLAARIDAGEISREFDLRGSLQAANAVLRAARQQNKSVKTYLRELVEQGDMFDAGLHPRTLDMLQLLVDNGTRVRARARIAEQLALYAKAAEASPAPVMFDEARIDYDRAIETALGGARESGTSGLRSGDGGGAAGRRGRQDEDGQGLAQRVRDGRDALQADVERQLKPRYGDDAAPMARVVANGFANLGAHYGETAKDVADAIGLRIEDVRAVGEGRRLAQGGPEQTAARLKSRDRAERDAALAEVLADGSLTAQQAIELSELVLGARIARTKKAALAAIADNVRRRTWDEQSLSVIAERVRPDVDDETQPPPASGGGRRFAQAKRSPEARAQFVRDRVTKTPDKFAELYNFDSEGDGIADTTVRIEKKTGRVDIIYMHEEFGHQGTGGQAVKVFTNAFNVIGHDMETTKRKVYVFQAANDLLGDIYERMLQNYVRDYSFSRDGRNFEVTRKRESQIRAERRALEREQRAADKGVLQAERQAAAFLAAADCFAREGFSDAGGRGASELLAGLAIGQAAAIPAGVLVTQAAQQNVDPVAYSREWLRRAREMGRQLEFPVVEPEDDGEVMMFEGQRVYRTDDDPDWSAPGRNAWTPPEEGSAGKAFDAARAAGARTPPAPPSLKDDGAAADEGQALIDAFEPFIEYTLEEREDLEAEALMEAFEPLIADERRRARREARREARR